MDRPVKIFAMPARITPTLDVALPDRNREETRLVRETHEEREERGMPGGCRGGRPGGCIMPGTRVAGRAAWNGGGEGAPEDRAIRAASQPRASRPGFVERDASARNRRGGARNPEGQGKYPFTHVDSTAGPAAGRAGDGGVKGVMDAMGGGGRSSGEGRADGSCGDRRRGDDEGGALPLDRPIRPTPCWPLHAVETLVRLWRAGQSTPEIAARLGMTARAIDSKLRKLRTAGIDLPRRRKVAGHRVARAQRRCLYCGRMFASSHVGNRLCPTCLEEGPFTSSVL